MEELRIAIDSSQLTVAAVALQVIESGSRAHLEEADLMVEVCNESHRRLRELRPKALNPVVEVGAVALRLQEAAQGQTLRGNDQRLSAHEVRWLPVVELQLGIDTPDVGHHLQHT